MDLPHEYLAIRYDVRYNTVPDDDDTISYMISAHSFCRLYIALHPVDLYS